MSVKRDHNVYILGAGFSREAGLPLMTDFLHKIRKKFEDPSSNLKSQLQRDYEVVLDYRNSLRACRDYIHADLDNIETLFSLIAIDCISDHTESANKLRSIRRVISDVVSLENSKPSNEHFLISRKNLDDKTIEILEKASSISPPLIRDSYNSDKIPVDAYTFFVAMLGNIITSNAWHKNTIITFNYDTIIENRAASLEIPISYGFKSSKGDNHIKLLKLHGSINWKKSSEGDEPDTLTEGNFNDDPLILPPTWQKNPEKWLQAIWQEALQSLSEATNIIVVGYSMPETDSYFKHLITAGCAKNRGIHKLVVIDTAQSVADKYKSLFAPLDAYQKLSCSMTGMSDSIYYLTAERDQLFVNRPLKIDFTRERT